MVMVTNVTSPLVLGMNERWGHLGNLFSPDGWRTPRLPYALDNGRFPAWANGKDWDVDGYITMLGNARKAELQPMWALVPDVVADKEATLLWWEDWSRIPAFEGWPLAFAVQDGMTANDVPEEAEVVFVGGSTEWKWANLWRWEGFPRVHVGRVNGWRGLWRCYHAGVESCDGTGWFRGDKRQLAGLHRFLRAMAGELPKHKQERLA